MNVSILGSNSDQHCHINLLIFRVWSHPHSTCVCRQLACNMA